MGLYFKQNSRGKYKIISSFNDKSIHKNWVDENEVKKILVERAANKYIHNVLEIYLDFPHGWTINDKIIFEKNEDTFLKFQQYASDKNNYGEILHEKYLEIKEILKIDWTL